MPVIRTDQRLSTVTLGKQPSAGIEMCVSIRAITLSGALQTREECNAVTKSRGRDRLTGQCITKKRETRLHRMAQSLSTHSYNLRVGLDHLAMLLWHSDDNCLTRASAFRQRTRLLVSLTAFKKCTKRHCRQNQTNVTQPFVPTKAHTGKNKQHTENDRPRYQAHRCPDAIAHHDTHHEGNGNVDHRLMVVGLWHLSILQHSILLILMKA